MQPNEVLEEQLQLRDRVLDVSFSLGRAVANELQLESLCDQVVSHLAEVFQTEFLALLFLDEETGKLHVKRSMERGGTPCPGGTCKDTGAAIAAVKEQRVVSHGGSLPSPPSLRARGVTIPLQPEPPLVPSEAAAAVPLIAESRVKGVLELSWGLDSGRPSTEDLHLLAILAVQVSTAIDNAWLYGEMRRMNAELEGKVRSRTAELNERNTELSRTVDELKQAQAQLVQSEKMASLGQLTAGIAHEINNPIAFSISNIALALEHLGSVDLRTRLLHTLALGADAPDAEAQLRCYQAFIDSLENDVRYREDVLSVGADLRGQRPSEAKRLARKFLEYVQAREERDGSTGSLVHTVRGFLERSARGLERVKNIVLDLRSFSRLDEAQLQTVDLDETVAQAITIVSHVAKERSVRLDHVRGMRSPYTCYPAKLSQVVLNLVTNALQATPRAGCVLVNTQDTPDGPVIEVTDTGCGIPAAHLPRIFDPFFTTKPVGEGTGLGLSISYGIIKEHGGEIRVESRPGKGSAFRIHLPPRAGTTRRTHD